MIKWLCSGPTFGLMPDLFPDPCFMEFLLAAHYFTIISQHWNLKACVQSGVCDLMKFMYLACIIVALPANTSQHDWAKHLKWYLYGPIGSPVGPEQLLCMDLHSQNSHTEGLFILKVIWPVFLLIPARETEEDLQCSVPSPSLLPTVNSPVSL